MKPILNTILITSLLSTTSYGALVVHFAFDEGSGTNIGDSSGNSRDLTAAGGTTWNASGQFGGSVNLGSALARTGGTQSATIASLNTVTGNQVTIAFWAQVNSESIMSNPFYINDSNTGGGNRIFGSHLEWSDGNTYWDAAWDQSNTNRVAVDLGLVADAMHHYVMTYDGDTGAMEVFKDNVSVGTATGAGGAINWAGIRNFELGALSFVNGNWGGEMDDFAIWNEVLDTTERTSVFQNGVAPVPEPSSTLLLGLSSLLIFRRRR